MFLNVPSPGPGVTREAMIASTGAYPDQAGIRPMLSGEEAAFRARQQAAAEGSEAAVDLNLANEGFGSPYQLTRPAGPAGPAAPTAGDTTEFAPVPVQGPPKAEPQESQLAGMAASLTAAIPMVGAQRVGLDKRQIEGSNQAMAALQQLGQEYQRLGDKMSEGEQLYSRKSDEYRKGLGALAKRGEEMRGARAVERQVEAQDQMRAEMGFDANRVYSDLARSPVSTLGVALAAGIVQGLQGYAGQDKPNAIIAAVQDAAQRDVTNQMEAYKRMQAGQQVSRNNFIEARQSLQDDQQALQVTAMATLDQISKGLEFVKARMARAKDRADVEVAQGKIKMELGAAATQLLTDFANRSLQAAVANQRAVGDIVEKQIAAQASIEKMGQEAYAKAQERVGTWARSQEGEAVTDSVRSAANFFTEVANLKAAGATDEEVKKMIARGLGEDIKSKLYILGSNIKGDGSVMASAFADQAAKWISEAQDPAEKRIRGVVASAYQSYLRQELGKSQTSTEMVNTKMSTDLFDADSVLRFMKSMITKADDTYNTQVRIDPRAAGVWYNAIGLPLNLAKQEWNRISGATEAAARIPGR